MPFKIQRLSARLRRTLLNVIVAACLFFLYDSYMLLNHHPVRHELATSSNSKHERVFIASIHWNNEKILRSHWNKAVVDLVTFLGPQNVFVAALENISWDNSKSALKELDDQLAMYEEHRSIILTTQPIRMRYRGYRYTTQKDGSEHLEAGKNFVAFLIWPAYETRS
jgi:hypothetical protein